MSEETGETFDQRMDRIERERFERAAKHERERDRVNNEECAKRDKFVQDCADVRHASWLEAIARSVAANDRAAVALERIATALEGRR